MKKIKYKIIFFLEKYLAGLLLLLVGFTYRIEIKGKYPKGRVIFAFWHRNIIPLIYLHKFKDISVLISDSKDGELIAGPVSVLGYKPIRGSSSKNSKKALLEMIKTLKKRNVAITPDGPKGPIYELKEGVLFLSYMSKVPILPIEIVVDKEWIFNSWDKFRFPKPFAKIIISYKEEVYLNSKSEFIEKKYLIENLLGQ